MNLRRLPTPVLLTVFAWSGAAGLGYQAVWVRGFTAGLGSETPAVLAVLAAVMAGLGLGGEGYPSFSIATPTGEGVTSPMTVTRQRRCAMVEDLRII